MVTKLDPWTDPRPGCSFRTHPAWGRHRCARRGG